MNEQTLLDEIFARMKSEGFQDGREVGKGSRV